jgi:hypothetical protein
MDRIAKNAPHPESPCFGVSHAPSSPECRRCVLFHLCGNQTEHRVTLDQLEFELTPPALFAKDDLVEIDDLAVNRSNVEDLYRRCYYAVFNRKWPESSNLGKDWAKIVQNAKAAGVSLNTFIATVMAAYQLTHPKTPFHINNLTAETSVPKVAKYSKMLKDQYGHDGMDALGLFTHSDTPRIEQQVMLSEILAGRWIVGCKMLRDGPALQSLYRQHELGLDPHWLAIEPTYIEMVLKPHLAVNVNVNESVAIKTHRERVLSTHSMLKKRKSLARTVFSARSQMMPAALKAVLRGVGHLPENFTHPNVVVTDALKFWNVLGLAVTHWECLKALKAEPHRLWH